jgi:hypothetical protein
VGLTVGAGWIPALILFGIYGGLAHLGARNPAARQAAVLDEIRTALRLTYPSADIGHSSVGEVKVGLGHARSPDAVLTPLTDETVRLLWSSRLYPLSSIEVDTGVGSTSRKVVLNRAERTRLRYRYGTRPYGPVPKAAMTPWD